MPYHCVCERVPAYLQVEIVAQCLVAENIWRAGEVEVWLGRVG